jgi:hypothetical protein
MVVALVFLGTALAGLIWGINHAIGVDPVVRYDCGIAEISPDYPVAVKEACRKRSLK